MKKLFAVFMSLHLILAPVAFAQEDKYQTEGSGGKGYDFVVNQALNIATSTLGANILTECYQGMMMPSIATFMAGSLVNVVAEIAGAKHKNKRDQLKLEEMKELETIIKEEKDSSQVSAMEALLVAEEDNLKFIESRKKWTLATTIIYAAAMGLAIAEEIYGNTAALTAATTACTATVTAVTNCTVPAGGAALVAAGLAAIVPPLTAAAAAGVLAAAPVVGPAGAIAAAQAATAGTATGATSSTALTTLTATCAANCAASIGPQAVVFGPLCAANGVAVPLAATPVCAAGKALMVDQIKAMSASPGISGARSMVTSTCGPFSLYAGGCYAYGNAYLTATYGSCAEISKTGNSSSMLLGMLLMAAYGFGNKSGGAISTYGSMATGLLQTLIPTIGKTIVVAYSMPIPRSVTFGAVGVLSGVVTDGLYKKANQANENIVTLKNAIVQLKKQTNGAAVGIEQDGPTEDETGKGPVAAIKQKFELKKLALLKEKECLSQSGSAHSSNSCSKPFKLSKTKFGNFNLPALNKVGALAGDMAYALINGNENGAAKLGDEIGSYAARVKQETEALKKLYNEGEKKVNRPTKDFSKSIKAQVASMQAQVQQAAKSAGVNLSQMANASTDVPKDENGNGAPVTEVTSFTAPKGPDMAVDPLAGMGTATEETPVQEPEVAGKGEQSLDEFESTVQDISKQPEVSIFKQLSNRYILNYTKMFNQKKLEEIPVTEDPPKN